MLPICQAQGFKRGKKEDEKPPNTLKWCRMGVFGNSARVASKKAGGRGKGKKGSRIVESNFSQKKKEKKRKHHLGGKSI